MKNEARGHAWNNRFSLNGCRATMVATVRGSAVQQNPVAAGLQILYFVGVFVATATSSHIGAGVVQLARHQCDEHKQFANVSVGREIRTIRSPRNPKKCMGKTY